jgi:2-iminobutanoate/2-iminopropanoate deaminase
VSTPVGPYSPAVRAGSWLVCSGQIGIEQGPDGPVLVTGGFEDQARLALANLSSLLWGRQVGWAHVVKTTVFLTDMANYAAFNAIYSEVLGEHRPARSVVGVQALPMGALVEIEAWAYGGDTESP